MRKPKNTDSKHLLRDDLKITATKAKRLTINIKSQPIAILIAIITQKLNFPLIDHKIGIFCIMATKLHQANRKTEGSTPKQPSKLSDQEPVCTKDKEIGTSQVIDSPEIMFIAGKLKYCYPAWKKITSDPVILNIINESLQIRFKNLIPCKRPFEHNYSQRDSDIISEEIKKLLQKQVITKCDINEGDFCSSLFFRPKKDGSFRTILN